MKRHKNKRKSIIPHMIGVLLIVGGGIAAYLVDSPTDIAVAEATVLDADVAIVSEAAGDVAPETEMTVADTSTGLSAETTFVSVNTTTTNAVDLPDVEAAAEEIDTEVVDNTDVIEVVAEDAAEADVATIDTEAVIDTEEATFSETMQVNSGARARSCPETSCAVVFTVRAGLNISVLSVQEGQAVFGDNAEWMEVEFEGQTGFIYSDLLVAVE